MLHQDKVRYSRQIVMPEVLESGQEKIINSKILFIGAGGLGSSSMMYLACAGVGEIGIIDADRVELSNLQRQIIHEENNVGLHKTTSAKERVLDVNSSCKVNEYKEYLNAKNADEIISNYDIVIDGSDNYTARYVANKSCVKQNKPFISAAIIGFEGYILPFTNEAGEETPCYSCIFPEEPPADAIPSCKENGLLGPVAGIAGSLQASIALNMICEAGVYSNYKSSGDKISGGKGSSDKTFKEQSKNKHYLLKFDVKNMEFKKVKITKDSKCEICS